jgi:hypothetical protein
MDEADRGGGSDRMPAAERESLRVALRGALGAQAAALDRLLERIAQEYGDELERIGRSPDQCRAERVRGLLVGGVGEGGSVGGGAVEGGAVAGDGAGLDYEIDDRWHLGAIAVGAGAAAAVRGLASGVDRRLLSVAQGEQTVWAWLGGRERFAVGEIERAIVGNGAVGVGVGVGVGRGTGTGTGTGAGAGANPPGGVVLAIGEQGHGMEGWRLTHQQAQAALAVARRRPPGSGSSARSGSGSGGGAVTRYVDVALLATALKDEPLGRALIDMYIAPLEDSSYGCAVLCETLRAHLAAGRGVSSTAAALGVTRSTVESRLRAVEQSLGRLLPSCLAELEVALGLDELGGPAGHR